MVRRFIEIVFLRGNTETDKNTECEMNATLWPNKGDRAGGTGQDIAVTANSATHARAHICSLRYLADSCGCPGGVPPGARTAPGALSASSLQPVNPADPRAGGSVCVRISVRVRAPVCAVPPGRAEPSWAVQEERGARQGTHTYTLSVSHTLNTPSQPRSSRTRLLP